MAMVFATVQTLLVASVRPVPMSSHTTLQHRWTPMAMACPTTLLMAYTDLVADDNDDGDQWTDTDELACGTTRRTVQVFRSTATLTVFVMRWTKRSSATEGWNRGQTFEAVFNQSGFTINPN